MPVLADEVPDTAPAEVEAEQAEGPAEAAEERKSEPPFDVLNNERLTGDWWGGRTWLEDRGVSISLSMTNIFQENVSGGVRTRNTHWASGSYDLELTLDTGLMKLWPGGTIYAYAEGAWDTGVSGHGYVGDLFGVNFDALYNVPIQLSELWYEQKLLDDKLRVRFGKLDLRVDFDTNAYANDVTTQFLNGGLNNTANIPFPDRGLGLQFVATPFEWLYFGAGVADAHGRGDTTGFETTFHGPADFFSIYEFGLTPRFKTAWGNLPGHYRFGLWYDPQPKEEFFNDLGGRLRTVPIKRDDVGFYVNFDQMVWHENPLVEGDEQGLGLFFRYGYAHGDVNPIENFWSVGGQYQGLIPTRDNDVLAFGVAQGLLSQQLRLTGADPHGETALELYYNIQLLPWLTLTPDFQWILCPGGENGRDACVIGVRLQMAF